MGSFTTRLGSAKKLAPVDASSGKHPAISAPIRSEPVSRTTCKASRQQNRKMVTRYGSKLAQAWKKAYERFLRIRGTPQEIALGFALGLFVGMSPFLGFHMAIAVFFAALFEWNKISAAVGVWISNPLTVPFIYPLTYLLGARVLGKDEVFHFPHSMDMDWILEMIRSAPETISILTLGGIIIGVPLGVIGYFFAYAAVNNYRSDIKRRLGEHRALRKEKIRKKRAEKPRKIRNIVRKGASRRRSQG